MARLTRQEIFDRERQRLNAEAVENQEVTLTKDQKIAIDQMICKILKWSGDTWRLNIYISMCSKLYGYDHHPKNHILVDVNTKLDTSYGDITEYYAYNLRFNGKGRSVQGKFNYHEPVKKIVRRV